jgi:hypothetical protein
MNLGMALEIVLSHETFLAVRALELSVSEMSLNMRLDVLLPSKAFLTFGEKANPFSVRGVRSRNERCNIINCDSSLSD